MKKSCLLLLLILLGILSLEAEEMVLRRADDLRLERFHVRTADNCEILFFSDLSAGDRNIYCQKLNSSGQPLWSEDIALISQSGDQELLAVVPSSDDNFIVLWAEYEISNYSELRAQKVSSTGQALWPLAGVLINGVPNAFSNPKLIPNSIGGAFIVYKDETSNFLAGQNLDSFGNRIWPLEGAELFYPPHYFSLETAIADGEGGMIINYQGSQSQNIGSRLIRISAEGEIVGTGPLTSPNASLGDIFEIMPYQNGQFILWNQSLGPDSMLRIQKIDNLGNFLMPQAVSYNIGTDSSPYITTLTLHNSPGAAIIAAWRGLPVTNGLDTIRMQKFDANFIPQWQEHGVVVASFEAAVFQYSLAVHASGNSWISWRQNDASPSCKAQVLNPDGIPLWETGGKTLSNVDASPMSLAFDNQGLFVWQTDQYSFQTDTSIARQVIDTDGTMHLPANGLSLIERPNGQAFIFDTIALGDRTLSIWTDYHPIGKIYYQIQNQNMEPLLALNGVALNPGDDKSETIVCAQKTPDGSVAVLYNAMIYGNNEYMSCTFIQKIAANGLPLYPGRGIAIADICSYDRNTFMGISGDDIYLGWNEYSDANQGLIKGQRITNGQKMWGEDGMVIMNPAPTSRIYLKNVTGQYYQWIESNSSMDQAIKVLRVDANGAAADAWNPVGMNIVEDDEYPVQEQVRSGLVGEDLVAFVSLAMPYDYPIRAQKISSAAQRLWQIQGVELTSPETYYWLSDVVYGAETALLLSGSSGDIASLRFQKISEDGQLLVDPSTEPIATDLFNYYDARLARFADGSYLCAFSNTYGNLIENRDLYYRMITPQGILLGSQTQTLCAERYQQENIKIAIHENQAVLVWNDDRAGIRDSETAYTGIWGNTLSSSYVANDDPLEIPAAKPMLSANYPNPFNPETTISFSTMDNGPISIKIFNLKGQLVKTLVNEAKALGNHSVIWNGRDDNDRAVSSGVYYYKMKTGKFSATRKMILMK